MTTTIRCDTIDRAGWAGLRRFSGTLDKDGDGKYVVPTGGFTPVLTVSVFVAPEDLSADGAAQTKAAMAYFDPATREILAFTSTGSKTTATTITFELVVMGY